MRGKSTPLPFATDRIDQLPAKDRVDASFKAKDQNSLDLRVRKDKNFVDLRTTRLTSRSELRPQLVAKRSTRQVQAMCMCMSMRERLDGVVPE